MIILILSQEVSVGTQKLRNLPTKATFLIFKSVLYRPESTSLSPQLGRTYKLILLFEKNDEIPFGSERSGATK